MELTDAWIALIGTVVASIGLEFVRRWLSRSKDREDSAAKMREELRTEVYKLREELRLADTELDKWRNNYFELKEQFIQVKANLEVAMRMIKEDNENSNPRSNGE